MLRLTKKIHSDILDHTLAYVDPPSYALVRMEWYYTSGGKITMSQQYRMQGFYSVLSQQHATIDIPHVRAVADASYGSLRNERPGRAAGSARRDRDAQARRSGRSASPEETRERILVAAREVIGRKGKRGATTREIADVAGVNEATLFRHFGTKEALLVACAQHFCGYLELADVAAQLDRRPRRRSARRSRA